MLNDVDIPIGAEYLAHASLGHAELASEMGLSDTWPVQEIANRGLFWVGHDCGIYSAPCNGSTKTSEILLTGYHFPCSFREMDELENLAKAQREIEQLQLRLTATSWFMWGMVIGFFLGVLAA